LIEPKDKNKLVIEVRKPKKFKEKAWQPFLWVV
jgi:hypothetical protein